MPVLFRGERRHMERGAAHMLIHEHKHQCLWVEERGRRGGGAAEKYTLVLTRRLSRGLVWSGLDHGQNQSSPVLIILEGYYCLTVLLLLIQILQNSNGQKREPYLILKM